MERDDDIHWFYTSEVEEEKIQEIEEEVHVQKVTPLPADRTVSFHKLFSFADGYDYFLMFLGTIGAAVHGLALPAFLFIFGKLLNSLGDIAVHPHKMYKDVSKYSLYFVYLGSIVLFSAWTEVACWMQTGERQARTLRIKYLEAILRQDVGFFDVEARTGEIIDTISSNTLIMQEAISEKMGSFLHFLFMFIGGFAVGFSTLWKLGLMTLAIVPGVVFFGGLYAYALTGIASKGQAAYSNAGNIAEEAIGQIRTVYSFVGEKKAASSYAMALQSTLKLGYKAALAKGLGVGSVYGFLLASWALLLWYGGVLVRKGSAEGGQVLSTIFAVLVGGLSLGQASPNIAAFGKARAAVYKVIELIKQVPLINNRLEGMQLPQVSGDIELQKVYFSYPSRPDVNIFHGISLKIRAGASIAIVGGSGSGKSTIISLIERFYDPTAGKILLDGYDIKDLHLKWLRTQMGLVNQEPALFATTIQENILYGKTDATFEEIENAARAANAHDFISQLPHAYGTQVGERGVQLSGGQKQRIAIARAMIKNPSILLFDEATSALDAESERIVQDALDKLVLGRTTVIVAHRLSTIRNADTIAVLQHGRVVELGTHDELISKSDYGSYAALIKLQELAKEKEKSQSFRENRLSLRAGSIKRGSNRFELETGSSRISFSRVRSFLSRQSSTASDLCINGSIETEQTASASAAYFWRLLTLSTEEWPFLLLGTIAAILAGLVNPAFGFVISEVLSIYYSPDHEHMKREVQKFCIIFAAIGGAVSTVHLVEHYAFGICGERLTKRIREMLFSAITRFEVSWFDRNENGSSQVSASLSTSAGYVRAAMGDRIAIIVQNGSLLISAFIIAFIVQWRVSLVVSATLPLVVLSGISQQLFLKGFAGNIAKAHARATNLAGEAVSNIRTVAAFNAEAKMVELVTEELEGPRRSSVVRGHVAGLSYGIASFLLYNALALGLWYGGFIVKEGKASFGDVIKAFFVLVMTANSISETVGLTPDIAKSGQALKTLFSILDRKTEIDPDDPHGSKIEKIKGEIELRCVDFYYPSRPDVTIFNGLCLKVHPGHSLAVVGASGSGKSSIIALVERFYDPVEGKVMVDGKDIKYLNLKSYRMHVGLVQQEPALFATSIYENIRYGKEDASESEVTEAAKAANAHNFISGLPDGYKTNVGERGAQLSGGQKQRVAIARAVLKNPSILLLDEATSALDAESERVVQEALDKLMKRRTTIVVAHRLTTIRNADQIAVIEDGKIIEQGTHWDLSAKLTGAYSRLIKLQQKDSR